MISRFERVARAVGVTPGQLHDAMDEAARARGNIHCCVQVKGVHFGRLESCRPQTVLWDVALAVRVEPEDLRDAIAEVYRPAPGQVLGLTHRVRLTAEERSETEREKAVRRERDGRGRFR